MIKLRMCPVCNSPMAFLETITAVETDFDEYLDGPVETKEYTDVYSCVKCGVTMDEPQEEPEVELEI